MYINRQKQSRADPCTQLIVLYMNKLNSDCISFNTRSHRGMCLRDICILEQDSELGLKLDVIGFKRVFINQVKEKTLPFPTCPSCEFEATNVTMENGNDLIDKNFASKPSKQYKGVSGILIQNFTRFSNHTLFLLVTNSVECFIGLSGIKFFLSKKSMF